MKKAAAIKAFGGRARFLELTGYSRQTLWEWPDKLSPLTVDRLLGVASRHGIKIKVQAPRRAA